MLLFIDLGFGRWGCFCWVFVSFNDFGVFIACLCLNLVFISVCLFDLFGYVCLIMFGWVLFGCFGFD